jgi:hypothetical protein
MSSELLLLEGTKETPNRRLRTKQGTKILPEPVPISSFFRPTKRDIDSLVKRLTQE